MKRLLLLAVMIMAGVSWVQAQRNVSGTVTDARDNSPLSGVSVTVKGTGTGTTTNQQG